MIKGLLMPAVKGSLAEWEMCACCGCQAEVRTMRVSYAGRYICPVCDYIGEDITRCVDCGELIVLNGEHEDDYVTCLNANERKYHRCLDCENFTTEHDYAPMRLELNWEEEKKYQRRF